MTTRRAFLKQSAILAATVPLLRNTERNLVPVKERKVPEPVLPHANTAVALEHDAPVLLRAFFYGDHDECIGISEPLEFAAASRGRIGLKQDIAPITYTGSFKTRISRYTLVDTGGNVWWECSGPAMILRCGDSFSFGGDWSIGGA
jgi:hypothetical protein